MEKKYLHKEVEAKIYKQWEEGGYFKPDPDAPKGPYTIVLPPPNSNGKLHVGHALMLALEDTLIRWKRMQGYSALWLPGTDHAGFETQVVFEKELAKDGKSRLDYDRNTLYQKIMDFVKDQGDVILDQTKALGPSLDWSRYTFTLDEHVVETVYNTFEKMHEEGFIYRENYIVNYCMHHNTTLSDLELVHKQQKARLFYIRYKLVDRKENEPEYVVVATTRPEPIFVDTHLAVNPKDEKNNWLIGRNLLNPLTDAEMEVIDDGFVDPEFGTGVVKLTPAHDKNDFDVALRHGLPVNPAFGTDGVINEFGGALKGLSIEDAREKALAILEEKDLIEKVNTSYENKIAVCYKCGSVIEPIVLPNWFVKVDTLKEPAHEAVKQRKVRIYPKWQETKYHRWMEEMRDWPISRQIVWGIRFPVWYDITKNPNIKITFISKENKTVSGTLGELQKSFSFEELERGLQMLIAPKGSDYTISAQKPKNGQFLQETDTFDTWFSSGHWPLVTLHYPDSADFKKFYPTSVLETGWEILRFWVSRMIMFGIYLTGEVPFKDVYLHGLVRAEDGQKMSKSLGNQVDPLEMVEEYGADALRMGLISGTATGRDFSFPKDKVTAYRNFSNKIWNMARFMTMMIERDEVDLGTQKELVTDLDKEINSGLQDLIKIVDSNLKKYRFVDAGDAIYHFVWHEVADKYIEHVKDREDKQVAITNLYLIFADCLKLLHPFMPFVTEEIWGNIKGEGDDMLIVSTWPSVK